MALDVIKAEIITDETRPSQVTNDKKIGEMVVANANKRFEDLKAVAQNFTFESIERSNHAPQKKNLFDQVNLWKDPGTVYRS